MKNTDGKTGIAPGETRRLKCADSEMAYAPPTAYWNRRLTPAEREQLLLNGWVSVGLTEDGHDVYYQLSQREAPMSRNEDWERRLHSATIAATRGRGITVATSSCTHPATRASTCPRSTATWRTRTSGRLPCGPSAPPCPRRTPND